MSPDSCYMLVRSDIHEGMKDIRIDALLFRWLVSATVCTSIRTVVESIFVGLDIVPRIIPRIILGSFHGLILG